MWMLILIAVLFALPAAAVLLYVFKRNLHIWLHRYVLDLLQGRGRGATGTVDLMVMLVDHFELAGKPGRLEKWLTYPEVVKPFRDADGCHPKHTWFSALDLIREDELAAIRPMVEAGFGEVELHWHHSHSDNATFERDLQDGLRIFQKYGYMMPYQPGQFACFSFIHGNWSLANSRGHEFCGIDNEIAIMQRNGCYADFTFPALFNPAQPDFINRIYYTRDDGQAAAYKRIQRESAVGVKAAPDEFMLFQGPLTINWRDWHHKWHPTIEDGDISAQATHGNPKRIDSWVRQHIHVKGQPNWVFVKLFCHGAQDRESVLGDATRKMHQYLTTHYNDGKRYRLHYVTAREAYNIVKAAEDGKTGNPNDYRDYLIPHPSRRPAVTDAQTCVA